MKTIEDALKSVLSPRHADGLDCSAMLYQYAAGAGTLPSDRAFRAHLETCADCRADLERFAHTAPAPAPAGARARGLVTWWRGLAVAAACAAVVLVVRLRATETLPGAVPPALTPKGAAAFHVGIVRDGKTLSWAATEQLLPGDELRFSYSNPQSGYPMLFAADEGGTVARVYPTGILFVAPPGDGTMGTAEIDARPGCQWLVACFLPSGQAPDPEVVANAVRQAITQRPSADCALGVVDVRGAEVHVKAKRIQAR